MFSSPGSVLVTRDLLEDATDSSLTTWNLVMSPPNSFSRFTAHGDMMRVQVARRNPEILFQDLRVFVGDRTGPSGDSFTGEPCKRIERHLLHQQLELFGERGLAAADRPEQIEDLLLLLQALGGMPEVRNDLFDGVFHAVEIGEGRIQLDDLVREDAAQPRIFARVDQLGLADGEQQALGRVGVGGSVLFAQMQEILEAEQFFLRLLVALQLALENLHGCHLSSQTWLTTRPAHEILPESGTSRVRAARGGNGLTRWT